MAEPYCLAMVLCDQVYRDAVSGKFTILGTFSTIGSPQYPLAVAFMVYFAVTDGHGQIPISLRIVNARADIAGDEPSANEIFQSQPNSVDFPSPLAVIESVAVIQAVIPAPGHYHCELYAADKMLMARRLLAVDPTLFLGGTADAR